MKIGFFGIENWEKELIQKHFSGHEIVFIDGKVTELDLPSENDFEIICVFVGSRVNEAVLNHFPKLRAVTTRSTGYDHIDLEACKKRGISVSYVPGYGDNTVAEFAFGLLLALTRKIYAGIDQIKETGLFSQEGLRGMDVRGKTIGVVGTGRIGKEAIKIAHGFGMNVIAYDPFPDENYARENKFAYVDFQTLLSASDVITLHCPLTKETHHLINIENISRMKRGVFLVNTARGGIIETAALIQGLEKKILAGVALDVLEEEGETKDEIEFLTQGHPNTEELKTVLENHVLMDMPNVLITPHIAFNSKEALERILMITLENIDSFIAGMQKNKLV